MILGKNSSCASRSEQQDEEHKKYRSGTAAAILWGTKNLSSLPRTPSGAGAIQEIATSPSNTILNNEGEKALVPFMSKEYSTFWKISYLY